MKKRSLFKPMAKGTYKIENKLDETNIYIYDEISWFGVEAGQFVKDLNGVDAKTINLHVNSPGGSVFDGISIFNAIRQHNSKVIAHVDGLAASIASVIIMAADEIRMGEGAFLMIHNPWSIMVGGADEMRKEADLLDKVSGTIANTYMSKSGKPEAEIKALMAEETWMTAEEALKNGFVDYIDKKEEPGKDKKAKTQTSLFDLSVFGNVPEQLKEQKPMPTVRDMERVLRDVGCSAKQAKAILSDGYMENDQRDVETESANVQEHIVTQRDVDSETIMAKKKDKIADLLIRAELIAPKTNYTK